MHPLGIDFLMHADALSKVLGSMLGGVIVVITAVAGFYRWLKPRLDKTAAEATAVRDTILGRDPIFDSITGRELAPALPGMGVRQDRTERQIEAQAQQMTTLTQAVTKLANNDQRISDLEHSTDKRLRALEEGYVERVVARDESAAAWRAVEAVAQSTPAETHTE